MERESKISRQEPSNRPWLVRAWTRLASAIVQDLPAMLNECESCRETDCTRRRWELCRRRQEALLALTQGPGTPAPVHS
jgi:hypothetical protein